MLKLLYWGVVILVYLAPDLTLVTYTMLFVMVIITLKLLRCKIPALNEMHTNSKHGLLVDQLAFVNILFLSEIVPWVNKIIIIIFLVGAACRFRVFREPKFRMFMVSLRPEHVSNALLFVLSIILPTVQCHKELHGYHYYPLRYNPRYITLRISYSRSF